MNSPNPGQQPYPMSPPPRKPFPVVPILTVFGVLLVLAVVGGIKAFHAVKDGSSEAIAVGNRFIDNMGRHNYPAARALFVLQVQAKTAPGDLKDIETLVEKHHGAFIAHGQPQWFVQSFNGQTSVRLTYPARFTRSTSAVSMTLVQTDKGYQVYEVHYEF